MDVEADALREYLKDEESVSSPFAGVWRGTIEGCVVVIVKSGAGKVCSAMATQWLIDTVHPTSIYNIGIAGGLLDDATVGTVVAGSQFVQHDFMPAPWLGRPQGEVPFVGPRSYPKSSPILLEKIESAAKSIDAVCLRGTILSGDEPIFSEQRRDELLETFRQFDPIAVDMESAAFAFVASENNIPFAVVRTIADRATAREKPLTAGANAAANGTATLAAKVIAQVLRGLRTA